MKVKLFYELVDSTQNVPEASDEWITELKAKGIMCECWRIIQPQPLDVYLGEKIKKSFAPITYATGTAVRMIRTDIIEMIGQNLFEEVFYLGHVFEKRGKLVENYVSLVQKKTSYIWGGAESTRNRCEKCGVLLYFALPLGSEYLAEDQVQNDFLFPDYFAGIIVNENIYQQINSSGLKKIGITKLPVRKNIE